MLSVLSSLKASESEEALVRDDYHSEEDRSIGAWCRCKFGSYLRIRGGSRKPIVNGSTLFANGVRRSVMLFEWLSPSMGLTTFLTMARFGVSNGLVALATTRACRATPESPSA